MSIENLGKYRIFTDGEGFIYSAAKKEGDKITILADTDDYSIALGSVLHDAGQQWEMKQGLLGSNYDKENNFLTPDFGRIVYEKKESQTFTEKM